MTDAVVPHFDPLLVTPDGRSPNPYRIGDGRATGPARDDGRRVAGARPAYWTATPPNPNWDHYAARRASYVPKSEYLVLEGLKVRAANLTRPVKKSELLRAGVAVLNAMTDKAFLAALNGVPSLKTGRPKGTDTASASGKSAK